ncbi:acylphosphatase [Candidatus Parcubacteria bacterium]|nr:acylphosphatase [Candidatus Parcubacteria bacterium]MBI4099068.1 acylphosphatase [Candidatus Parcubacteria bacterium]MBI4385570.1 acylphosphatase [Candidatus Parcubacteria bacterium]
MKHLTITVHGFVQGVLFRTSAQKRAVELGLVGWARNDPAGTVSLVAEGSEERLKEFLEWCYTGPRWARVEKVNFTWGETEGNFTDFEIQ